jgi:hypothetical protein
MNSRTKFLNNVRLVLFIVIVSLLYTTPRAPKGQAADERRQQQQQQQQQQQVDPEAPGTGILPAKTDLYKQYEKDTADLERSAEEVQAQNADVFRNLHAHKPAPRPGRMDTISYGQARNILEFTAKHPIVGMKEVRKYDPEKCIGFCFGRAMFIHLELLARGINKDSIRKAYVVGEMNYEGITWGFHVATAVKGSDGSWLVIDPEFDKVETVEEWFKGNLELSPDKKLRLYMTDANKFGASAPAYDSGSLKDDWYNRYFVDALKFFRERDVTAIRKVVDHRLCRDLFN